MVSFPAPVEESTVPMPFWAGGLPAKSGEERRGEGGVLSRCGAWAISFAWPEKSEPGADAEGHVPHALQLAHLLNEILPRRPAVLSTGLGAKRRDHRRRLRS